MLSKERADNSPGKSPDTLLLKKYKLSSAVMALRPLGKVPENLLVSKPKPCREENEVPSRLSDPHVCGTVPDSLSSYRYRATNCLSELSAFGKLPESKLDAQ